MNTNRKWNASRRIDWELGKNMLFTLFLPMTEMKITGGTMSYAKTTNIIHIELTYRVAFCLRFFPPYFVFLSFLSLAMKILWLIINFIFYIAAAVIYINVHHVIHTHTDPLEHVFVVVVGFCLLCCGPMDAFASSIQRRWNIKTIQPRLLLCLRN